MSSRGYFSLPGSSLLSQDCRFVGFIGRVGRRFAHVDLACDNIGGQANSILVQQLDLAAGASNSGVNGGNGFVEMGSDGGLLGEGRDTHMKGTELIFSNSRISNANRFSRHSIRK